MKSDVDKNALFVIDVFNNLIIYMQVVNYTFLNRDLPCDL